MLQFVGCATKSMKGCDSVGHASRSSGLLRVEASLARVSQCSLKTGGDATVGGARDIITEVTLESSGRRMGRGDGLHRTLLPHICRFQCIRP
jgi:hypothetical protein